MKIYDWLKRKEDNRGKTSGDRIQSSYKAHQRSLMGLPVQKKAWLIDYDGKRHCHDLDIQSTGEPHGEVKTVEHVGKERISKVYKFWKTQEDYLLYIES